MESYFQLVKKQWMWSAGVVLSLVLLAWVCFVIKSPPPYHLAVVAPLSGPHASYGRSLLHGIQYYIKQVNDEGGVKGKPVALKIFDEPDDPGQVTQLAQTIADDKSVLLVLGHLYSDNALAAGPVYQQAQLSAITITASDNAITKNNPWFFMLAPNNHFQGAFTAHYINNVFASKTVGIIYDADASGTSLFESFSHTAHEIGIEINYRRKIDHRQADVDQVLEKIAADFNTHVQPDILYLATQAKESANLLSLIQFPGNKLILLCSMACAGPQFLEDLNRYPRERAQPGYYSDNLYVVSPFILDTANQQAQTFSQQFIKTYPSTGPLSAAAYAHDAAALAVAALRTLSVMSIDPVLEPNVARRQVRDALTQHYNLGRAFPGVTGPLYFDLEGNANTDLAVGYYHRQKLISAPVQYRNRQDPHELSVDALLDDLWSGEVFMIGDSLLRRSQVVYTGIDINSVKQIDERHSRYNLDFYLWFRFDGDFADRNIQFDNALTPISLGEPLVNETVQGITTRAYAVNGDFQSHFRFNDYPFDRQQLFISFHHKTEQADRLLYVSDIQGLKQKSKFATETSTMPFDLLQGLGDWSLERLLFFQDRINHPSSLGLPRYFDKANTLFYSQFNGLIQIKRDAWRVLLKNLFPVLLLILVAYLAYFMPASQDQGRINLATSAMITTAFFHLKLITAMAVDDLMVIEYFFFAVYVLSVLVIFISMVNAAYLNKIDDILAIDAESLLAERYHTRIKQLDLFGKLFHPSLLILLILILLYQYH